MICRLYLDAPEVLNFDTLRCEVDRRNASQVSTGRNGRYPGKIVVIVRYDTDVG